MLPWSMEAHPKPWIFPSIWPFLDQSNELPHGSWGQCDGGNFLTEYVIEKTQRSHGPESPRTERQFMVLRPRGERPCHLQFTNQAMKKDIDIISMVISGTDSLEVPIPFFEAYIIPIDYTIQWLVQSPFCHGVSQKKKIGTHRARVQAKLAVRIYHDAWCQGRNQRKMVIWATKTIGNV